MRIAKGVALIVALAAQAGCGSGGGSPAAQCDGGCQQVTPAEDAFLTNLCTLIEGCCVVNADRTAPDVAGCKAQAMRVGFSHDPAVQSACLSELQGLASAGTGCFPDVSNLGDPCNQLYYEPNGTKQPGEACTSRAECAGTAGSITLCINGCMRLTPGQAGETPCLGDVTEDGVIEAVPYAPPNSTTPISTGAVCEKGAGLYCTFTQGLAAQSCQPLQVAGATCAFSRTCASGKCAGGDQTSGAASGACTPVASAGQPCRDDATLTQCDQDSYCEFTDSPPGVCVPKLPLGAACRDSTNCTSGNCYGTTCMAGIVALA